MRASLAPTAILILTLAVAFAAAPTATAWAQDPSPVASPPLIVEDPLDPRAGSGANRVGAPLLAAVVVIAIGALAALGTAVFVRLTQRQ